MSSTASTAREIVAPASLFQVELIFLILPPSLREILSHARRACCHRETFFHSSVVMFCFRLCLRRALGALPAADEEVEACLGVPDIC